MHYRRAADMRLACCRCPTAVVFACALAGAITTASAQVPTAALDPRYVQWDLSSLVSSDNAWEAERAAVVREMAPVKAYEGSLTTSASRLADGLDAISALRRHVAKMAEYAYLKSSADTRSQLAQAQYATASALEGQVEQLVSFADDEIRAAGEARIRVFLQADARLNRHRARMLSVLRDAPHVVAPETEAVLRATRLFSEFPQDVNFRLLEAVDLWPTFRDSSGQPLRASANTYAQLLRSSSTSAMRDSGMAAFLNEAHALGTVFAPLVTEPYQLDVTVAQGHKFANGFDALLFKQGIPPEARSIMITQAHAHLSVLHRFFGLRARALGVNRLGYPDLFRALPLDPRFTLEEALDATIAAMAPLGPEYQARLRQRFAQRWWNFAATPEKRDIWGAWPAVNGNNPFGMMAYRGDLRSATLVGAIAATMMKATDTPADRKPDSRDDDAQSIYGNGLVYAGRMLVSDLLMDRSQDRSARVAFLVATLDDLRARMFDDVRDVEFASWIEDRIIAGDRPDAPQLTAKYLDLLRTYYGQAQGIVDVAEPFGVGWVREGYPYYGAVLVNFPMAFAAGCQLVEGVRANNAAMKRGFYAVIGRGDSDRSYDLLAAGGVDLASSSLYDAAFRRMAKFNDELEALLNQQRSRPG